ncbi:MFS transporter [Nocardioides nanhaiensis]|uniref:Major facilitator superfamily (MFS) profile domain-containing protein n=1 Tax=Nocardioides nanhaiensis TaxID=1476871 RepID=A0ABP8WM01_9ACTN
MATTYGVVRYGFGLQLPQLSAELGIDAATAGLVAAGAFASYCLVALLAGRLVLRRGARPVLWLAATLGATGAALVATAPSVPALAVGVVVGGGAAGAASPALVVAVGATVSPGVHADRAQAVVNAGTGVGVLLAGSVVLAAPLAWRPMWWAAAVASVVTATVVDRAVRWPSVVERVARGPDAATSEVSVAVPVGLALLAGAGSAAVWTFGRDLVVGVGGLGERTGALLWVLLGVAAVLGALSGDAVRLLGLRGAWAVTATGSAAGTWLLAAAPGHVPVAALGCVLFGGSYTALSGVLIAWAAALRPENAGATTARLFVALTAGQALGAAAVGALVAVTGQRMTFLVAGALLLLAGGLALGLTSAAARPRPDAPETPGATGTLAG